MPLLVLRQVVEAEDAGVLLAGLRLRRDGFGTHARDLILSSVIALVFSYEVRETAEFERVYGTDGEWAQFFRQGRGYIGTELLRDAEVAGRYLVVDRWESADAYNSFVAERREEYMERVDATRFHYDSELRFGTFETLI
jgi:heme-degrading monooxygenase HmoA